MKKIVSLVLASAVAMGTAVPAFAATFKDVNEKEYAWAYEYVEDMAEKGLINGYGDGLFKPGNTVSRMEAFVLFARLMGADSDMMADAMEASLDKYGSILKPYSLSYAEGDIAYLLYRGVIDEGDLDTYFKGSKKSEAMPRHEAAALITKAMLAEDEAKDEVLLDMDYTDVSKIPAASKQYVYYVSEKGIMSGMGDGLFSPDTAVLRGQIAAMLSRTYYAMNYYFEAATLVSIDNVHSNMKFKDSEGSTFEIGYSKDTKFFEDGEEVSASKVKAGQNMVLTYSEKNGKVALSFADLISTDVEETKNVIFQGYSSQGGNLRITALDAVTGEVTGYDCKANAIIKIDDAIADINKLKKGDYITIGLAGETIATIDGMQKNTSIKATLEKINPFGTIIVEVDGEEQTYALDTAARVIKNNDTSDFASLYRGDIVTLTLEYGIVTKINATSSVSTVSGVLKGYMVSSEPFIVIKKDGKELTYDLPSDVKILINGEISRLADCELGSNLTLTVESNAVKKVELTTGGTFDASSIVGTVTGVNAAANVVIVSYMEAGSETSTYITCTNSTKYYLIPSFSEYNIKSLKVGDTVVAYGSYANGIFVCTGMNVTPAAK